MYYYQNLLLFMIFIVVVVLSFWSYRAYRSKKLLEQIAATPFPSEYHKFLGQLWHYRNLSPKEKSKIETSIVHFLYTKSFVGAKDLVVSDEMRVLIAFYACLLLLHRESANCYDNLKTILIYPHPVLIQKVENNGGIFNKEQFLISGQSINDTVVIIWDEAKREIYHPRHDNVVIHEFAHEIDLMDGIADGVLPLERSLYNEWTHVLYKEFDKLHSTVVKNRDLGKYALLGEYASTNEAEFFAVVTERFYESPQSLKKHFPDIYSELKRFYNVDPAKYKRV